MKHLDPTTLNEYLDDALDARRRAEADAHLETCADCRRELAALRALTASFDAWHAEPIPHDVSVSVMTRLATRPAPSQAARWGALVLAGQVVLVGLFLTWLLPMAMRVLNGLPFALTPTFDFSGLTNFVDAVSAIPLPFPSVAPWILIAALLLGAVIWLIGNRLLLQSVNPSQEALQ